MASYKEYVDYFEDLCKRNVDISHVINDSKNRRFYRIGMEELFSGSFKGFPQAGGSKPIFVFINYITDYNFAGQTRKSQNIMFWIIQSFKAGDYDSECLARAKCEEVLESFLTRMRFDSEGGHPLFKRSFDKIEGVRSVPTELKASTVNFVGMQVNIPMNHFFEKCYEPNEWTL